MIHYKDRTFCQFFLICKKGHTCPDTLTDDVKKRAAAAKLPICCFADMPKCFVPFFMLDAPKVKK